MTTTDRLLADLIAHLRWSHAHTMAGSDILLKEYAAERLALAEQQETAFPGTAEPPRADWIEGASKHRQDLQDAIQSYLDGYEFRGDTDYTPSADEFALIQDVIQGLICDDQFRDAFIAAMPSQQAEPEPEEVPVDLLSERDYLALWHLILDWSRRTAAENPGIAASAVTDFVKGLILAARRHAPYPREVTQALRNLLEYVDINTCTHEETHRGGAIWTICDECGQEWADDEGGFVPHQDAPAVAAARGALEVAMAAGKRE